MARPEDKVHTFADRVAVIGWPDSSVQFHAHAPAPWSEQTLKRVGQLGFNAVQLNLAWGRRPDDEPLNIEDIVELASTDAETLPQVVPLRCQEGDAARDRRRTRRPNRWSISRIR